MSHPALIDDDEIEVFLSAIKQGDTYTAAAAKAGWSLSMLRNRMEKPRWAERFAEAKQIGAIARADKVDSRVEELVYVENPAPSTVALWAKRHNPGYRDRVEVTGDLSVTQTDDPRQLSASELRALGARAVALIEAQQDESGDG